MKITAIRLTRMRLPLDPPFHAAWDPVPRRHFDATLVRVETDEGVTGYGSGDTMDGFGPFETLFTGRDPLRIADHVRTIESIGFHAGRYWPLEAALWDIIGQVTGQPVSVLFGGAGRRLPAYASFGEAKSPRDRAEAAVAAKAAGFRAVKIRISRTDLAASLDAVRATRAAVGADMAIMADLNQWWRMAGDISPVLDGAQVRRIAAELADLGVFWLEEPLPGGDLDGMRALRGQIRVAGGEMARTPGELLDALEAGAARRAAARCGPVGRPAAGQDHRRAGPAATPLVHPAHLDQRPRPAGQPARGGRRGRRPLRRVPLGPARLDRGAPRLLPGRAHPHRPQRQPGRPRRPRPGRRHRP
jgi:L-alanine-DL-glutamate epimerase-like enolase superfamily enzyme